MFKISESMVFCILGVWMFVVCDVNDVGNIILIDIEGMNLGDNEVMDLLSIFVVFMFLGVVLFVREVISNYNI